MSDDQTPKQFLSMSLLLESYLSKDKEQFLTDHPEALVVIDNPGQNLENATFATIAKSPGDTSSSHHEKLLERLGRWAFLLKRKSKFASMITVGRDSKSDMRLNVPSVSKFHAYFTYVARDKSWYLADANSSNGTFINGDELPPSHGKVKLENGAMLRFGPDVTAQFYDASGVWEMLNQRVSDTPSKGGAASSDVVDPGEQES